MANSISADRRSMNIFKLEYVSKILLILSLKKRWIVVIGRKRWVLVHVMQFSPKMEVQSGWEYYR